MTTTHAPTEETSTMATITSYGVTTEQRPRHAAPNRQPALTAVPGQSFLKLVRTELRKSVDTRSGRVLLLGILALALAGIGWRLTHLNDGPVSFEIFIQTSMTGVQLLLPVIGIMAMTSEWTQRTALTTFTLSPRRVRVQLAKFTAAVVLSVLVLTAVVALVAGSTALGGAISGDQVNWGTAQSGLLDGLSGVYLANALNVVMGAAMGAVLAQTAIAVVVYFVAPTVWSFAGTALLKSKADWLDVFGAFGRIAERDMGGKLPESLTAIAFWIVLPTVLGLWISSRREVK
jgi:ABC-type transport system involved in multi-copper enzyme maturation permease subunit